MAKQSLNVDILQKVRQTCESLENIPNDICHKISILGRHVTEVSGKMGILEQKSDL